MKLKTLLYERKENVALITLNRPEVLNATNWQMWQDLSRVLDRAEKDKNIRVVIVTGTTGKNGKETFSVGADLKESSSRTPEMYREYLEFLQKVSLQLIKFSKPTIAAINGYAIGSGYELALACDIRIAAKDAIIRLPEARVSSSATGAATKLLPELVGMGKAKEMLFTCQETTGEEAEKIGLVNKAVFIEDLMSTALETAEMISQNSPFSIKLMKDSLDFASTHTLEEIMDYEVETCLETVFAPEREKAIEKFQKRSS